MKYITFLLNILIAITFAWGDNIDKTKDEAKLQTESAQSMDKDCNKHNCCKNSTGEKKECQKDSSCKHKCFKDSEKYKKKEMCEKKPECKKDSTIEHKCGEGKCGKGKCDGDAKGK